MFGSLFSKLATVLLGLFFLVGALFIVVSIVATDMYQQEVSQKLNRELAAHIVPENQVLENSEINRAVLEHWFHQLMVFNPSIEIYLLNDQGDILAFSAPPGKVVRQSVDLDPIARFLSADVKLPILGDDPRGANRRKVFSVAEIRHGDVLEGYLYIILGGEEYDGVVQLLKGSHILTLSLWVIVAGLGFSLLAGLLMFRWLTRRLSRLSEAMDAFKQGAPTGHLALPVRRGRSSYDEIDRLTMTFGAMAEQIERQIETLKSTDKLRRELVANVSHDLRTPLATLQGYIETLLMRKQKLSPDERQEYLEIALHHCERLNNLVKELFELATLDAKETQLQLEPFNLSELIQDLLQKFQLSARRKNIEFIANFSEKMPMIQADIGLIERVLENLIENALRHTPAGGSIDIALTSDHDDIIVKVSDTGCGIPREELPYIFDRFYQLDKSRGGKSMGSGLGLAIAKRILELHSREIEVNSMLDRGTTFSFRLPAYN